MWRDNTQGPSRIKDRFKFLYLGNTTNTKKVRKKKYTGLNQMKF